MTLARKSNPVFVADFETTTDPDDCRVWGWGIIGASQSAHVNDVEVGTTIKDFFNAIDSYDSTIYFHNLAFDGSFILDHLLKTGYTHTDDKPGKGQFTTLISDTAKFYSITVRWRTGHRTEFRDSMKKIPLSVARMAKAFHLELGKLVIDYDEYRSPDHIITEVEREYIASDVVIVAQAIAVQLDEGMRKLTVGADSLAEFKKLMTPKVFSRLFPVLGYGMDADIRKAYRGGWTYCDSRFSQVIHSGNGKEIGSVYDVNSLYPSVMMYDLLPYGVPQWFDGAPEDVPGYPLFIMSFTFTAKIKPGHVPCIQVKGSSMFNSAEYVSEVVEPTTLSITNVDYDIWNKHYDLDILAFDGGWYFRARTGFFSEYIKKWSEIKINSTGGMREIAKLHLNSLYGKFASNPNVTGKYPVLDKTGTVQLVLGPPETRDPVYTAMGVFITAYARSITITAAQENYGTFAYADTDSIHLLTTDDPQGVVVDPSALGAWKREYNFTDAIFWRAKAYSETEQDGTRHTHIAGLPVKAGEQVGLTDFETGRSFGGKLLPKRVPGGIVLVSTSYTLK